MKKRFSFLALLSLLVVGCVSNHTQAQRVQFAAYPAETVKVSDITWRAPFFGYRKGDTNHLYVPLTQGLVLTPHSTNFESLILSWLAKHTNAEAIVVYTWEAFMKDPDPKVKSVWMVDGEDCLNIYLVQMGGCPAYTMLLNQGDKTPVTRNQYEAFAEKIIDAEASAKRDKLGIWGKSRD